MRICRSFGLGALLALNLLLLAANCARAAVPEGDALYQRFSQLVLQQFAARGYNCAPGSVSAMFNTLAAFEGSDWSPFSVPKGGASPAKMDFKAILGWESDFAADPRYWQLRAVCGLDEVHSDNPEGPYHSAFLDRMQAGCADEGSWKLLPLRDIAQYEVEQGRALLSQAAAGSPANSYWQYQIAFLHLEYGEVDHAWDALKAGNALPSGHWPQAFPYTTLYDPAYSPETEDEWLVRGVVAALNMDNIPNMIRISEDGKTVQAMLALGFDPGLGDDFQTCLTHLATMGNNTEVQQAAMAAISRRLAGYCANELLSEGLGRSPRLAAYVQLPDELQLLTGIGRVLQFEGSGFGGAGTDDTPFRTAFRAAWKDIESRQDSDSFVAHSDSVALPALQKQDWLNFAHTQMNEQQAVEASRAVFERLPAPPLADLYAQAEASSSSQASGLH